MCQRVCIDLKLLFCLLSMGATPPTEIQAQHDIVCVWGFLRVYVCVWELLVYHKCPTADTLFECDESLCYLFRVFFFCLDCTVQVQRLKSDNFVTFHFEKAFFVHSLHVPANVHLLFSTVHTVRALELGFLATLPLLMIAQWRLELVHTTTVRTRESHPGTVRVHRATHHVSNTAAGVAATTARAASAANRTRLNVHRTYGEWSREDQRDRPFAKRGDQGHCAAGRKQWHREAGVQLIPGQTSDLCDAQILR